MKKTLLAVVLATIASNANAGKQLDCLVQNMYHEARGERTSGLIAVAQVTMNRVDSKDFPNTICDVVWEHKQFSWTQDGKSDIMWNPLQKYRVTHVAQEFLRYRRRFSIPDITGGSMWYHAQHITPYWASSLQKTMKIGNHIFYKKRQ